MYFDNSCCMDYIKSLSWNIGIFMEKTLELQKLIDNNSYVKIEKGVYLTAPLFLHSNMTIEIEEGAILLATIDESKYNEKLSKTDSYNIIALFDNRIVGVCTSDLQTKLRRAKKQCFIEDLIVDQNYRNIGVGTSLLKNVIEFAKQQDCEVVKLSSFISNVNAHKLYEKNGFVKQSYEFKLNL